MNKFPSKPSVKPCNAATYRQAAFELALSVNPKIVVEVGVYAGALSRMLAKLPSLERLTIVDSWVGGYSKLTQTHMDGIAASVIEWAGTEPKAVVHRMDSVEGAKLFVAETIDFFHTDGDHSLDGICNDITAWLPKVKVGGILSGDNYECETVAEGVDKLLPHRRLAAFGRLWWAVKL